MTEPSRSHTFRLFKNQPGSPLLQGMASLLDLSDSNRLYNYDQTPEEADLNSLRADWLQVGADLSGAMREYAAGQRA